MSSLRILSRDASDASQDPRVTLSRRLVMLVSALVSIAQVYLNYRSHRSFIHALAA